jgi:autotransporter-associated beta strand protein
MRTVVSGKRWLALAAAVSSVLGGVPTLRASDYGGANPNVDNNWNNPNNWSSPSGVPTATDDVQFFGPPPASGRFVNLPNGAVANTLAFFDYYSLQGGSLALTDGTINVDAGNVLSGGGFSSSPVSLSLGTATISSTLVNPSAGLVGLTKNGSGTLILNTATPLTGNSFGGAGQTIAINGGRLAIASDAVLGSSANNIAISNAMLTFTDSTVSSRNISLLTSSTIDTTANPNIPNRAVLLYGGITTTGTTNILTKTGFGTLDISSSNSFTGKIVLATSGGTLRVQGASGTLATPNIGAITSASGIVLNPATTLAVDNHNNFGPASAPQSIPSTGTAPSQANILSSADRIADSIPITLQGGAFTYSGTGSVNNPAAIRETVGTVTMLANQSSLGVTANGGSNLGAEFAVTTLNRGFNTTLNITASGTPGAAGNNGRLIIGALNDNASPVTLPTSGGLIGGWLTLNSTDFVGYTTPTTTLGGVNVTAYGSTFASGAVSTFATSQTLASGGATIAALRLTANGTNINFAAAGDVLNIESGGLLAGNANEAHAIGSTTTRGVITAGGASGSGAVELFVHQNQNTMTIHSVIQDNGGRALSLVKDLGGGLTVTAVNTYSGGTFVYNSGDLNASPTTSVAGVLGTGPATISNSRLLVNTNINAVSNNTAGAWNLTTSPTYTVRDTGQLQLVNQAFPSNQTIRVSSNSVLAITGTTLAPTLVFSGTGQNVSADAGAVVSQSGTGQLALVSGLPSTPTYFFGIGASHSDNITVGDNTPWYGISTSRDNNYTLNGGTGTTNNTITYNSDFILQGFSFNNTYRTLTLGNGAGTGTVIRIIPGAAASAKVTINGGVALNNDQSVFQGITFVGSPGSTVSLNQNNAMGGGGTNDANSIASLIMQQGSMLDIGGVVTGPINGTVTLEPGATFRLDDNPTTGNFNGTGTLVFKPGSYIQFQTAGNPGVAPINVFQGAQLGAAGNISGVVVRFNGNTQTAAGINGFGVVNLSGVNNADSKLVTATTGKFATDTIYEMINGGTNTITTAFNDPTKDNILIDGGIITSTYNGGTLNAGGGRIIVGPNGLMLAGGGSISPVTANNGSATLNIIEDIDIPVTGRTVTIGYNGTIDGLPKANSYVFLSNQGSRSVAGGIYNVVAGAQAQLNAFYALPALVTVNLNAGTSLLHNTQNAVQTFGALTGSGNVAANNTGETIQIGYGDQSGQFDGIFAAAGSANSIAPFATQNFGVTKMGGGTLTLTGASTDTGTFNQNGGTTSYSGAAGSGKFAITQLTRGTVQLQNTGSALSNRLGNGQRLRFGGGTLQIVGNSGTAVTETVAQLDYDGGGTSVLDLSSPGAGVTLNATNNQGRSITTLLLRGNLGSSTAKFTVNSTGLTGTFAAGVISTGVRADILHDNGTAGTDLAFTTYDTTNGWRRLASSEYTPMVFPAQNTTGTGGPSNTNLMLSGQSTSLAFPVSAVPNQAIPVGADTQVQSLTVGPAGGLSMAATRTQTGAMPRFNIASGGMLVQSGTSATISAPYFVNPTFDITTVGNLALNGIIANGGSFIKAGAGTLTLSTGGLNNSDGANVSINGGSVVLGANSSNFVDSRINSAFFTNGTAGYGTRNVWINSGSLDLNGNNVVVGQLSSSNYAGSPTIVNGGDIINTGAPADLASNGSQIFTGSISGVRNLTKWGNNTQVMQGATTLSGDLIVRGGQFSLREGGKVTGVQNIAINVAQLQLNNIDTLNFNQKADYSGSIVTDRIPSNVPITMAGSLLQFRGAAGVVDTQTYGNTGSASTGLRVTDGANQIDAGANSNNSTNVTISNLLRDPASRAVVNFTGSSVGNSGELYSVSHIVVTNLNGAAFDTSPTLPNGIIGPWAIVNGSNWATYRSSSTIATNAQPFGYGISNLGNTSTTAANNQGFTGYSALAFNAATGTTATTSASDNINSTGGTEAAGVTARTINTLRSNNGTTATTFTFNAGETLTLASGGIITDTNQTTTFTGGAITSTYKMTGAPAGAPSQLYTWVNQGTTVFASVIADNAAGGGAGAVSLIKSGPAILTLSGANTFTGGAVFNQATTNLSTASADGSSITATGTGDVVINGSGVNATIVNATTSGQIANGAVVTFNGGNATLNLQSAAASATTSTLGGLVFNNIGGGANAPVLSIATLSTAAGGGTLVLNGNITVVNDNFGNVPTINQIIGATAATTPVAILDLGGATRTIDTTGLSFQGLNILASVTNGGITKTGPGILGIGVTNANLVGGASTSTLTGGITINGGGVRFDSPAALGGNTNTVTVNPGTQLLSNLSAAASVPTNVTLAGGTLQSQSGNTPTYSGNSSVTADSTISLRDFFYTTASRNITVTGPISVTGTPNITVVGGEMAGSTGTLLLNNAANNFTGATISISNNVQFTAQSAATGSVGSTISGANIRMSGGRMDVLIGGLSGEVTNTTLALNNPVTVTGNAQINIDRGASTTATANTIQFGQLTLGDSASNADALLTLSGGNSYVHSFGGGVAGGGITLADGRNLGLNNTGSTLVVGTLKGAPQSFTKYGNSQVTVNAWDSTFSNSGSDLTVAAGVLQSNATSGTAFSGGTLTTRWGTLTGTIPGTGITGTLRNAAGAGNTVTYAPTTIVHEGLIQANTGTMNFAGKFIGNGAAAPGSSPFSSSFSEKFFNGGVTDTNITLSNATSYFSGVTPSATGTLTTQRLSFESRQVQARARDNSSANGTGALWSGSFTVGGGAGQIPAGPVSFGLASDDGSTLYVDYNHNNTFETNEMVIDNRLGHGVQALVNTTPSLAAGSYNFAVAYYNSGPATNFGSVELRYYPGAMGAGVTPNTNNPATGGAAEPVNGFQPVPYANQYIVAPGGQTMAGNLEVDNATMNTGGFNVDTITIASGGLLTVDSTAPASIVANLFMNSGSGTGTLDIASGKTVTVTNAVGVGTAAATTLAKTGAGTLLVNGTGTSTITGAFAIHAGTLGGFGSIAGPLVTVNSGANLAPGNGGNSAGILTIANTASTAATVLTMTNKVNGTATLGANSNFLVDIVSTGTTAGTDYDQLKIVATNATPAAGNISLGGLANLVINMTGIVPSGNQYVIVDNTTTGSTTGTFAGLNEGDPVTVGAQQFTITYVGNADGDGQTNDVILTATVPEPASFGLLGLGAIGLLSRRRRRRA